MTFVTYRRNRHSLQGLSGPWGITTNSEVRTDVASVDPGAGVGAGLWALQTGVLAIDALLFPLVLDSLRRIEHPTLPPPQCDYPSANAACDLGIYLDNPT